MNNIYLTKLRKRKYMDDFLNKVLPYNEKADYKLDEGLPDILTKINSNNYIQTLCSKRSSFKNPDCHHISYVEVCYTAEIELCLFREIIPLLFLKLDLDPDARLSYLFKWPRPNPYYLSASTPVGLGYMDDKNHFLINTIKINLESNFKDTHTNFWNILENSLTNIKP